MPKTYRWRMKQEASKKIRPVQQKKLDKLELEGWTIGEIGRTGLVRVTNGTKTNWVTPLGIFLT